MESIYFPRNSDFIQETIGAKVYIDKFIMLGSLLSREKKTEHTLASAFKEWWMEKTEWT